MDARDAGFGDFDVVIKGVSRATIEYIEEEEALYKIKYHVSLPGLYLIEIKYDLKHIPGKKKNEHLYMHWQIWRYGKTIEGV